MPTQPPILQTSVPLLLPLPPVQLPLPGVRAKAFTPAKQDMTHCTSRSTVRLCVSCHGVIELCGSGGRGHCCFLAAQPRAPHHLQCHGHHWLGDITCARHHIRTERRAISHVAVVALIVNPTIRICSHHRDLSSN